jgi:hypothetical protein
MRRSLSRCLRPSIPFLTSLALPLLLRRPVEGPVLPLLSHKGAGSNQRSLGMEVISWSAEGAEMDIASCACQTPNLAWRAAAPPMHLDV